MSRKRLRIGIVGCGTIGGEMARACVRRLAGKVKLYAICDSDKKKAEALRALLKDKPLILPLGQVVKECDFVVEAASAAVSADVVRGCAASKKACLVMSIGGLVGNERLLKSAEEAGVKVFLPSGAICGIDGLKSAAVGRIDSVTLTTTKPPRALAGAPYLVKNGIDASGIREDTAVFEGDAKAAVKGFPQNINVSAVLSLAGIGARKTRVRIIASPSASSNVHELEVRGEFGRITTRSENVPSRSNPKTSALAVFSAIATLEEALSSVRIGT